MTLQITWSHGAAKWQLARQYLVGPAQDKLTAFRFNHVRARSNCQVFRTSFRSTHRRENSIRLPSAVWELDSMERPRLGSRLNEDGFVTQIVQQEPLINEGLTQHGTVRLFTSQGVHSCATRFVTVGEVSKHD